MIKLLAMMCLFWLGSAHASEYAAVSVPMVPIKVGKHSYYVQGMAGAASSANQGFMSNAGFVVTKDSVLVFDTLGTPSLAAELVKKIREITPLPIKRVIISHYHADHFYGLQVFKELGAESWAHKNGQGAVDSEAAAERLTQRRETLFPWVDENTKLLPADKWLDGDTDFEMGGVHFLLRYVGPAHTAEDMAMLVKEDGVLYTGDLVFRGRVPFVGDADSKAWLTALNKLIALKPRVMVAGHGAASLKPQQDLEFTRDYLEFLRKSMGQAVANLEPFDEAYAHTDWSKYARLPAFEQANRQNAYNTYLLMEKESLAQ
ncbi:MBL fold metallo-hydrolase [Sulfuriferula sp. AH1]|uniref:MBL fold metallo-hydrolase n=1 Tax=Sulfuriferula sp. AH1 TaxID=1985873 RepID=UPI000B3B30DB|nr:MBL fold metallo-hydrolase [Sulfuriferula sp. AH1]ARU32144.1 MBL fold metallo-hydrolase [Sulfuriferula sp. AH1]